MTIPALHTHTYVHAHASRLPGPPLPCRVDISLNYHVYFCLIDRTGMLAMDMPFSIEIT